MKVKYLYLLLLTYGWIPTEAMAQSEAPKHTGWGLGGLAYTGYGEPNLYLTPQYWWAKGQRQWSVQTFIPLSDINEIQYGLGLNHEYRLTPQGKLFHSLNLWVARGAFYHNFRRQGDTAVFNTLDHGVIISTGIGYSQPLRDQWLLVTTVAGGYKWIFENINTSYLRPVLLLQISLRFNTATDS